MGVWAGEQVRVGLEVRAGGIYLYTSSPLLHFPTLLSRSVRTTLLFRKP